MKSIYDTLGEIMKPKENPISLEITAGGGVRMLHDDRVDLGEFGDVAVERASHVEFDNKSQKWYCQSAKTLKILRADFATREEALRWEKQWYSPGGQGWQEIEG